MFKIRAFECGPFYMIAKSRFILQRIGCGWTLYNIGVQKYYCFFFISFHFIFFIQLKTEIKIKYIFDVSTTKHSNSIHFNVIFFVASKNWFIPVFTVKCDNAIVYRYRSISRFPQKMQSLDFFISLIPCSDYQVDDTPTVLNDKNTSTGNLTNRPVERVSWIFEREWCKHLRSSL